MKRSEVIANYLKLNTHADLAALYTPDMEVQVNVAQGNGERVEAGDFRGKAWIEWTDGIERWKSFRMPLNAMSTPENNDYPLNFNLEKHVDGIGLTGWDFTNRISKYVAYDFDAMVGHSDKHTKKLSDTELLEIQNVITKLPFLTLRKSTSGKGLHLYIFLEPIETSNHTEHAALARAILSMIAGKTGYNFTDKVDICGGNMWIYHRKQLGTDGLKLIRQGDILTKDMIPSNWKDHSNVVSRRAAKIPDYKLHGEEQDLFDKLTNQRNKIKLDEDHLKLINWLSDNKLMHWWNADEHMLVTHTAYLKEAHPKLGFKGEFHTNATGKDYGNDINCFMYPCRNGVWAVRRYGTDTKEHPYWKHDKKGWTRCYYNRPLTLEEVARIHNAIELENKSYQFKDCDVARTAMGKLGIEFELPSWILGRIFKVKEITDNRYSAFIPKEDSDNAGEMKDWAIEKGAYKRVMPNLGKPGDDEATLLGEFEEAVRHVISEGGGDLGWMINTGTGNWREEPLPHIRLLLKSKGLGSKDIDTILGASISRAWTMVNRPFEPEYLGDRQWNRSRARFKIPPTLDGENLSYPTWQRILDHCGRGLDSAIQQDSWCKNNGIIKGGDYLKLWFASLIKFPRQPLPYLGLYGDQDCGKSTLHEAFCQIILDGGYMRADNALTSSGDFNGELQGSVLCTLEEINLGSDNKSNRQAYNKLKDWVTSTQILLHAKRETPILVSNFTHWLHCANDRDFIPVFPGDTRVTLIKVDKLRPEDKIPKRDMYTLLVKEASDFLAALLITEIPDSRDRLMLPVITTIDKKEAEYLKMDPVGQFFKDRVYSVNGQFISSDDLFEAFKQYLGMSEAMNWNRNKFGRLVPKNIPKGRISSTKTQETYYGNISLNPDAPVGKKWIATETFMKQIDE